MAREFDIIIFGATGYTGQLISEYLVSGYSAQTKIAIAGRNENKLSALRRELTKPVDILIGDSSDLETMRSIASRARLVVSCAGPFILYGSNLIQACAENGTDYVDVTGETYWSSQMLRKTQVPVSFQCADLIACHQTLACTFCRRGPSKIAADRLSASRCAFKPFAAAGSADHRRPCKICGREWKTNLNSSALRWTHLVFARALKARLNLLLMSQHLTRS